ncbi:hypothetical protein FGADI_12063 [Fusarium gaditjirri]|uniref:Uncharacterized protein n=1 Tax=Fusarium gaditjirri TaxID=282569 RepID=A0A8H4ST95_9HYPO|nr:hypothetical protein FGADI_12063 [Fusarium gaditjirri]
MASIGNELKELLEVYIAETKANSEKIHYRSPLPDAANFETGSFVLDTPRLEEKAKEQAEGKSRRQPVPKVPKQAWELCEGFQRYVKFDGDGESLHIVEYLSSIELVKHRVSTSSD